MRLKATLVAFWASRFAPKSRLKIISTNIMIRHLILKKATGPTNRSRKPCLLRFYNAHIQELRTPQDTDTRHSMKKPQLKVPLNRPIFTEEALKTAPATAPTQSAKDSMATELLRIEKMPKMPGRMTIRMMEEFKKFPWTQNTMLMVGHLDEALREFLEKHLEIDGETV